jgi:hypothetical protein
MVDVRDRSLLVNRTNIKTYTKFSDLLAAQFMLHHILNLKYAASNYYNMMEVLVGLHRVIPRKATKALKAFLGVYSLT